MTLPAQIFLNIRLAAWRPVQRCAAGRVAALLRRRAGRGRVAPPGGSRPVVPPGGRVRNATFT
jgi:hypothetical protein